MGLKRGQESETPAATEVGDSPHPGAPFPLLPLLPPAKFRSKFKVSAETLPPRDEERGLRPQESYLGPVFCFFLFNINKCLQLFRGCGVRLQSIQIRSLQVKAVIPQLFLLGQRNSLCSQGCWASCTAESLLQCRPGQGSRRPDARRNGPLARELQAYEISI